MTDEPAAAPPPGRPRLPRRRWSKVAIAYGAIAVALTAWSLVDGLSGRDLIAGGSGDTVELPASVRASPGGYRSFAFWHSGYEGGK